MVLNNDTITHIKKEAHNGQWPFPKVFEALKSAGVKAYQVEAATCKVTYFGESETMIELLVNFYPQLSSLYIAPVYDEEGLKSALTRHQTKQTDYSTFLKEIAAAGVNIYHVNMQERTVSYHSNGHIYNEKIPQL